MNGISNRVIIDSDSVKNCWLKIKSAKGVDFFIDNFYQVMFEHHPDVHALFSEDTSEQKTKLLTTLDNVINGIDYIEELEPTLIELGLYHKDININEEMYDAFISIIVETANTSSDHRLTAKELTDWENAFREISNIMLKAYN